MEKGSIIVFCFLSLAWHGIVISDHLKKDLIGNTFVENTIEEKNEGKKTARKPRNFEMWQNLLAICFSRVFFKIKINREFETEYPLKSFATY